MINDDSIRVIVAGHVTMTYLYLLVVAVMAGFNGGILTDGNNKRGVNGGNRCFIVTGYKATIHVCLLVFVGHEIMTRKSGVIRDIVVRERDMCMIYRVPVFGATGKLMLSHIDRGLGYHCTAEPTIFILLAPLFGTTVGHPLVADDISMRFGDVRITDGNRNTIVLHDDDGIIDGISVSGDSNSDINGGDMGAMVSKQCGCMV